MSAGGIDDETPIGASYDLFPRVSRKTFTGLQKSLTAFEDDLIRIIAIDYSVDRKDLAAKINQLRHPVKEVTVPSQIAEVAENSGFKGPIKTQGARGRKSQK